MSNQRRPHLSALLTIPPVCNNQAKGKTKAPLQDLGTAEEEIFGRGNTGQFAMNGWDEGPPDITLNDYENVEKVTNVPCNAVLITKRHKRLQQNVWFPYMEKIYQKIQPGNDRLLQEEMLLLRTIPLIAEQNQKTQLPTELGQLPVVQITDIWRQFKTARWRGISLRGV